ncbi:alpha/beta fold hydrolase [Pseudonocardia humida]|uniref:Alpha/beta hydrolase n=1 Tax=Pseudonocardia humida TaxID=2800819 RepID=A0ABT0ZY60_9PSEU|nr:alpha/beta hydrolase [Pseudonocardia humida]MCO1655672.1 alpha/beta hydrolase [Pseudonocardia humida]
MTEQILTVDGARLCAEVFGDRDHPAVLLIGGASASMDWWDVELCERLAAAGRRVVRYDHRDTGRSACSPPGAPAYTGDDLGTDAIRVLDGLGIAAAHLVGVSMGGGIAQELAVRHPRRVRSITLIATSPAGERAANAAPLSPPWPGLAATFTDPPPDPAWDDPAAVVAHLVAAERLYAGPGGFDEAAARRIAAAVVARSTDPAAAANHWVVAGDATEPFGMSDIAVPTLVLHGTADPLLPFDHGEALAAEIAGATLVALPDMGHQVPPRRLWDVVVPAIVAHTGGDPGPERVASGAHRSVDDAG